MPFVLCTHCAQVFHEQRESRYYWCRCGEPLTDGDEISALTAHRQTPPATGSRFARSGEKIDVGFPSLDLEQQQH
jgi:hypothetical protein